MSQLSQTSTVSCSYYQALDHSLSACPYFAYQLAAEQEQASMAFQRPKNEPFSPYHNLGCRNHLNFSWNTGPNATVSNFQPGMFPRNNSRCLSHPSNSFQRSAFSGVPNAPRPTPPIVQVQPSPGYTDIDKLERRINNNMERMINANMERIMRMMTEQFSELASSSKKLGTFLSQPEVNPKGHTSPSSGNPSEPVRKVNVVISLHLITK